MSNKRVTNKTMKKIIGMLIKAGQAMYSIGKCSCDNRNLPKQGGCEYCKWYMVLDNVKRNL